jgi:ArsR family transcriptional regulator, arsenate/arsenite/antimonite-responsive transcriptional repressor
MDNGQYLITLAETYQALSDPNRLKILGQLLSTPHPVCVKGLAGHLGISQSAVSQHLKVLKSCRLVVGRKDGYFKHYSVNETAFREIRRMERIVFGRDLIS